MTATATLAVVATGMLTGVGLSAPASCAAIRCAIDNFRRTGFIDSAGKMLMGSEVPLDRPWRGVTRLRKMAAAALRECMSGCPGLVPASAALVLCLAENDRPGRLGSDDQQLLQDLQREVGARFHARSGVVAQGHASVAVALQHARDLLVARVVRQVLVVAADSLLTGPAVAHYEAARRLLTSKNSDGFIPGEAAAAVALELARDAGQRQLCCRGIGFGMEKAHIASDLPLRADGLAQAIRAALAEAGWGESVLRFKIIDASGEQYHFKEASLAFSRLDRTRRKEFDVWHPADCIGEVGAAIGPVMIAVLHAACAKGYDQGTPVLMHMGNDAGERAALVFSWQPGEP